MERVIRRVIDVLDVSVRLGLGSVFRVLAHRAMKVSGFYQLRSSRGWTMTPPMLRLACGRVVANGSKPAPPLVPLDDLQQGRFGAVVVRRDGRPDWLMNPYSGTRFAPNDVHWSRLEDFDPSFGDIKTVWEPSRMQWAVDLARAYRMDASPAHLDQLCRWLDDWTERHPPFDGPNWMCGQETALRLMHVLLALELIGDAIEPTASLKTWITRHLERIAQAHHYAVGQCNNHWTSEAAGLFLGAAWLSQHGDVSSRVRRWLRRGRRSLERAVRIMVLPDGTFAQYSTNYHRVLVDTLSVTELLRRRYGAAAFSSEFSQAARRAVAWLREMTSVDSGLAPNFGANDGAYLFRLDDLPIGDMRPSVQLGSCVFNGRRVFASGPWDERARLMGVLQDYGRQPDTDPEAGPVLFEHGGFASMPLAGTAKLRAYVRFPRYRFRPAQSDALHVDIWHGGQNVFGDAGSFTYATELETMLAFAGPAGHNTVQFDGREQMPRIGRFLYARWLRSRDVAMEIRDGETVSWRGRYRDHLGAQHERCVTGERDRLIVEDRFHGHSERAVLRWRTPYDVVAPNEGLFLIGNLRLCVDGDTLPSHRLVPGWTSPAYLERRAVNVLEWTFGPGAHEVQTTLTPLNSADGG